MALQALNIMIIMMGICILHKSWYFAFSMIKSEQLVQ